MPSTPPKVVLTEHLDEQAARWLATEVNLVRQSHQDPAALHRQLADAQGLIVRTYTIVDEKLLKHAPNLKVVARAGVGLDNIDLAACAKHNVRVVYTPDANTQAVVEYIWFLIGDAIRPRYYLDQYTAKFHEIRAQHLGKQLDQMTLGILGMGRIGRRIAQVAHAIGMRVLYNDLLTRRQLKLPDDEPSQFVDKPQLYLDSDILTIHTDGRPQNRNLINAEVLSQLKPSCILLNAARGMLIDNPALAAWSRHPTTISAGGTAYLDVHEPEPPPDDYPLFNIPNIKLLPHLASRTPQAMSNMSWVVRDVVRVLKGEEPKYPAI